MPTYRYRCAKCGDELEVWQSFADTPLARHNGGCGGKLAKVMSPAGIVLKGSGFYKTDNRASSGSRKGGSSDGGSGSESSSSESKSSSKNDSAGSKGSDSKGSDSKGSGSGGSDKAASGSSSSS
jgi:putative FmdB family regulatory protein